MSRTEIDREVGTVDRRLSVELREGLRVWGFLVMDMVIEHTSRNIQEREGVKCTA